MSAQPLKVAEEFLHAFGERDIDRTMALVAEDAQVTILPAGIENGTSAQAKAFLAQTAQAFPDLRLSVHNIFTGRDGTVVAQLTLEGTQAADYLGVLNQEKHLDVGQAWVLKVNDGRIEAIRAYWCQNQLYRRLAVRRLDHVSIV